MEEGYHYFEDGEFRDHMSNTRFFLLLFYIFVIIIFLPFLFIYYKMRKFIWGLRE